MRRFTSSLLLLSASLYADVKQEPPPGIAQPHSGVQIARPSEMYNPAARPIVLDGPDVFVFGEVLFARPVQGGMEFAYRADGGASGYVGLPTPGESTTFPSGATAVTRPLSGTVRSTVGKWDWGFRIGMGYNMRHDGWDVNTSWLRFHTRKGDTTVAHTGAPIVPLMVPPYSGQNGLPPGTPSSSLLFVNRAATRWKLHIDIVDLEVGREYYVSQWMTLRPFMSARFALIPQRFRQTYSGGTFVADFIGSRATNASLNTLPSSSMTVHLRNRFWGVGPRAGMTTIWGMIPSISLYGNADFSLLWGNFHVRSRFDTNVSGVTTQIVNVRNNHETIRPTLTLGTGLRYDHNFHDAWALGFLLGYEQMLFWDQNQFMKFGAGDTLSLNAMNDNLALAALHCGIVFDF
jgi:hypothetical protein